MLVPSQAFSHTGLFFFARYYAVFRFACHLCPENSKISIIWIATWTPDFVSNCFQASDLSMTHAPQTQHVETKPFFFLPPTETCTSFCVSYFSYWDRHPSNPLKLEKLESSWLSPSLLLPTTNLLLNLVHILNQFSLICPKYISLYHHHLSSGLWLFLPSNYHSLKLFVELLPRWMPGTTFPMETVCATGWNLGKSYSL